MIGPVRRNLFDFGRKPTGVYEVRPIECGTLTSPKDALTLSLDRDIKVTFPVLAFLVRPTAADDDAVVLVDTGVKRWDDDYIQRRGKTVGGPAAGQSHCSRASRRRGSTLKTSTLSSSRTATTITSPTSGCSRTRT